MSDKEHSHLYHVNDMCFALVYPKHPETWSNSHVDPRTVRNCEKGPRILSATCDRKQQTRTSDARIPENDQTTKHVIVLTDVMAVRFPCLSSHSLKHLNHVGCAPLIFRSRVSH